MQLDRFDLLIIASVAAVVITQSWTPLFVIGGVIVYWIFCIVRKFKEDSDFAKSFMPITISLWLTSPHRPE